MNKKTIKQKLRNLKLKATALWWFLTRKNYYLLTYNKGCKSRSLESYNIDILSFIDQVQRWHNMLTAHGIPVYRHRSQDIQERQHPSRQERLGIRQTQDLLSHSKQRVGYGKEIR